MFVFASKIFDGEILMQNPSKMSPVKIVCYAIIMPLMTTVCSLQIGPYRVTFSEAVHKQSVRTIYIIVDSCYSNVTSLP